VLKSTVAYSLAYGERDEFFTLLYGRGQRLFAEHMLAGLERILRHGKVLRVGRANVDRIDRRIAQDIAVVAFAIVGMEKPAPRRRAASTFLPAIAATSTDSSRRNASRCTRPMKPVPKIAILIGFIVFPSAQC
jgi:hypothetical protein